MSGTFPYFEGFRGVEWEVGAANGGVGATQLEWLRAELKRSKENEEKVLIFCHLLVHPKTTSGTGRTLLWNYDEVLEVIQKVGDGCVKCVFSGHQHEGGVHVGRAWHALCRFGVANVSQRRRYKGIRDRFVSSR